MNCIKCNTPMILGQAINPRGLTEPNARYFCPQFPTKITIENLELLDCWKCLKCGQSDYIEPNPK